MSPKIISSFGLKKKTLSLQKEKKLLGIVIEGIKKIKKIASPFPKNKDIYQVCQELLWQSNPQQIEKREKRKPTFAEKEKWGEIKETCQKIEKAVHLLLRHSHSFVKYLERGYYYSGKIDHEDLTTEGVLSLLRAVEKFDPSYNRRLSTYSGHGIRQRIKTFIDKNQLINQTPSSKQGTKLVYYDSNYQSDKESSSYSLMETLSDSQISSLDTEGFRQQNIKRQINELLNTLDSRETNLVIRWLYKIVPTNLFDIYCLATKDEKTELQKEVKTNTKSKPLYTKKGKPTKICQLSIVQRYLVIFSQPYASSEIARFLNLSKEKEITRFKSNGLEQLKKLAQEKNLHLLVS